MTTPSADIPLSDVPGEDLYPEDEEAQRKIVSWVEKNFIIAKDAKSGHQERWVKFYKMYRSYVKKRGKSDWRSRKWMPIAFYIIETITPRLVAQLPGFKVDPVGPEDSPGADLMEEMLKWAADKSDMYLELVKATKSSLLYGTGILKTLYDEQIQYEIKQQPEMTQGMTSIPTAQMDVNGQPMMAQIPGPPSPTGKMLTTRTPYTAYQGPVAQAVDIDCFFPDPVADSIESARYVIHQVYRDKSYLEDMFQKGVYKKPPNEIWQSFLTEHAALKRQDSVDLGSGSSINKELNLISLLEVWTDKVLVTVAGAEQGGMVLLRADRNPFAHGEKPFVRIVDHLVPHEFWGIGELEPLEGIQDALNALWNSRIDNVMLNLNTMFTAVMDYILDPSDLQVRPGGVIRVTDGIPLDQAVRPLEMSEVTSSSYTEAQELMMMSDRVSGTSPFQSGMESQAYNRTATGIALVSEQGNTRFSHKVRIAELTGYKRLARHYGSILQQYTPAEMVLRIANQEGGITWQTITAEAIGGRFDYDIEAESSTQTESTRREQTLSLAQELLADPYMKPLKIRADLLKTFGRKDVQDYLYSEQEIQAMQQQAQQQQAAQAQGGQQPAQGG